MNSTLTSVAEETLWAAINLVGPSSVKMKDLGESRGHNYRCDLPVDYADNHYRRSEFLKKFGYAVPSADAINAIREFLAGDSVLEIGAGRALWAALLKRAGVEVEATDKWTPKQSGYDVFKESDDTYTHVRHVDAQLASELTCHGCLMTVWPPYGDAMAAKALAGFRQNKVIYIGEWEGCTANDAFHLALDKDWIQQAVVEIPKWWGLHDAVYLYVRKSNP